MKAISHVWLLSLAAVVGMTASAQAQVFVRAPFVTVQVGPGGVCVRAPFVNIHTAPRATVYPAPPMMTVPGNATEVLPAPRPENPAPPQAKAASRVPTLQEFASTFKPTPGSYEAVILHPATKQPVQLTFTLPPGEPRRVRVQRNQITFIYRSSRNDVSIRFLSDGRVQVTN